MKKITIPLLLAACMVAAAPQAMAAGELEKQLAEISFGGGWKANGPAKVYDSKNLFELIDGEAELYFPYGFKQTIAITYTPGEKTGETIDVEIYELGTVLDAFGVYSNYRDTRSALDAFGTEGFLGTTQAMFYQDRFFAKLRLSGKALGNKEALKACAEALAKALPPNKEAPEELELLKVQGVIAQTERYLAQSVLGYDFFTMGLTADTSIAQKTCVVFVVLGMSTSDAEETTNRFVAYLDQNKGRYRWEESPEGKILLAIDPLHKGVVLQRVGTYVVGIAKLATPKDGLPMLAQLRAAAEKKK